MSAEMDRFQYDDAIVRKFLFATVLWAVVGMLVGVVIGLQLTHPMFNLNLEWFSFGRLRPLHTNAVIFAFAGNALFCGIYYSSQRLLKARMFSDALSKIHFWGWQAIIVSAALTLPLGISSGKEYAELEWPIDIAIALIWVVFAVNFFGTVAKRRERHLYVALWFYIASIITVAVLHIFNSLAIPAGLLKSYSIYAGVQDAFMQWWYGHNAVAFFLTTPFLGIMYYFLPKAADRPVFSYRLSILHFWSIVFLYIWAGPHHLHYTALPSWASTLGMIFSVMLWMPSWGGMINGLMTMRGAWNKLADDPVLKFLVVGVTFYGMATLEGPAMSIKSLNAITHYTDWTIGHVHSGALGWNGLMTAGILYWLAPRLFQTELFSKKMANLHFIVALLGIILYVFAMYVAGVTQFGMWREFDDTGRLVYPDFIETVIRLIPMYVVRVIGGTLFFLGYVMLAANILLTWMRRPAQYEVPTIEAPPLAKAYVDDPPEASELEKSGAPVADLALKTERFLGFGWHRTWERLPVTLSVMVAIAVIVASLFEIIPTFLIKSNVPTIASVQPYTPLELMGRDIYMSEGCYNCHSQMIRPFRFETERYGEYSKPGEFVYDHPFQWGSKRTGPDLHRLGGKYPHLWHVRHMEDPKSTTPQSIMPKYPHLLTKTVDFDDARSRVSAMKKIGVPYTDAQKANAIADAMSQAEKIAEEIVQQGGSAGLADKRITALIAYMQRLGTDIKAQPTETHGETK